MNAMIMAAGMGTRLKPWTETHPKALVPVDGVPALEILIRKLEREGFRRVTVNVHHFGDQIIDYLDSARFSMEVSISDERTLLLDTGGGIAKCGSSLVPDGEPVLVHNVDILSNAHLSELLRHHKEAGNDITLLTSARDSSRRLIFDAGGHLCGWHNVVTDQYRPEGFAPESSMRQHAFSGIYVLSPNAVDDVCRYAAESGKNKFSIMDYLLSLPKGIIIREHYDDGLQLLDIGKPERLAVAGEFLSRCQGL